MIWAVDGGASNRPDAGAAGRRDGHPIREYVCTVCVVTRLNIYLPDDLATEVKRAGLNLSAVTQDAVRRSLAARSTDAWLATLAPAVSHRVTHERVLEALDAGRDEPPTRHG